MPKCMRDRVLDDAGSVDGNLEELAKEVLTDVVSSQFTRTRVCGGSFRRPVVRHRSGSADRRLRRSVMPVAALERSRLRVPDPARCPAANRESPHARRRGRYSNGDSETRNSESSANSAAGAAGPQHRQRHLVGSRPQIVAYSLVLIFLRGHLKLSKFSQRIAGCQTSQPFRYSLRINLLASGTLVTSRSAPFHSRDLPLR